MFIVVIVILNHDGINSFQPFWQVNFRQRIVIEAMGYGNLAIFYMGRQILNFVPAPGVDSTDISP